MLISTKGRYGLRIMVDMAGQKSDSVIALKDIAQRQDISLKYLENIMKSLVKADLVKGVRGKGGGYRLSKKPEEIEVNEILYATEGAIAPVQCLAGKNDSCPRADSCKTLPLWCGLNKTINDYLASYTLDDLVQKKIEV